MLDDATAVHWDCLVVVLVGLVVVDLGVLGVVGAREI